jgi:hypothetical protein
MDNKIIMLMPNKTALENARSLFEREKVEIPVYEAIMNNAVQRVTELIEQGTKVVISRGRTCMLLRSVVNIPIIDIRYSFLDFVIAAKKAREYSAASGLLDSTRALNQVMN